MPLNLHVRVIALSNRQDIIADLSEYVSTKGRGTATFIGDDVWLPDVFYPNRPRILVMHQSTAGRIEVGMAPVNVDDPDDAIRIPFMATHIVHSYRLPENSKLLATYLKAVSRIDLSAALPPQTQSPRKYTAG